MLMSKNDALFRADIEMLDLEDTKTPFNVPLCAKYKQ